MTAQKMSITLPEGVAVKARAAADRAGLTFSAWLASAAMRTVVAEGIDHDLKLLADLGYTDDPSEELAIEEELARHQGAA